MKKGTVVEEVHDIGNDVLVVTGTVDGEAVSARGWLSAIDNHFDAAAYGPDGHRHDAPEDAGPDGHRHDVDALPQVDDDGNDTERDVRPVDGHTHTKTEPREMTEAEQLAYCKALLEEAAGPSPERPRKLSIKG